MYAADADGSRLMNRTYAIMTSSPLCNPIPASVVIVLINIAFIMFLTQLAYGYLKSVMSPFFVNENTEFSPEPLPASHSYAYTFDPTSTVIPPFSDTIPAKSVNLQ